MKVPTYYHRGDNGNNVADAIWGTNANTCNGKYFFEGATAIDPAYPAWGPYRDVTIFAYDLPTGQGGHFYKLNGGGNGGGTAMETAMGTVMEMVAVATGMAAVDRGWTVPARAPSWGA